jgi:hypothetical protein
MIEKIVEDLQNKLDEYRFKDDSSPVSKLIDKKSVIIKKDGVFDTLLNCASGLTDFIEQIMVVKLNLSINHDLKKDEIEQIIINSSATQTALYFSVLDYQERSDVCLLLQNESMGKIGKLNRELKRAGFLKLCENSDNDEGQKINEELYGISDFSQGSLKRFFRKNQGRLNLINFSKDFITENIATMNYDTSMTSPAFFYTVQDFLDMKNIHSIRIKTKENYFYMGIINNDKKQMINVLNLKTVFSELQYENILSTYFKKYVGPK